MYHNYETMRICVTAYLQHIRVIDTTLGGIAEDIARVEAQLELRGVSFGDPSPDRDSCDKLPDGMARIQELRDEWVGVMSQHAEELAEAKRLCSPAYDCRYTLWLRIVERRTWGATSRMIGYSVRQTHRLAKTGIHELYALMPERWRREPIPNAAPK